MARFKWTKDRVDMVAEMFKAGEPRRFIHLKVGCTLGEFNSQMSKMKDTRQPLNNQKFAEIEANYFKDKQNELD